MERLARGESTEPVAMREAMTWVEGFIGVALTYLAPDAHERSLLTWTLSSASVAALPDSAVA
jgi:hypothetical protein